jgi:hypothetical protein
MRLLHTLRDLTERLRRSRVLSLFQAVVVIAVAALFCQRRAWAWKTEGSSMPGNWARISDLGRRRSAGADRNTISFKEPNRLVEDAVRPWQGDAGLKGGGQPLNNPMKTASSSHSPQLVIHPARNHPLRVTTGIEAKEPQPIATTLVEEEQAAERGLARAPSRSDLSPPYLDSGPAGPQARRGRPEAFVGLGREFYLLLCFLPVAAAVGLSLRAASGHGGAPTVSGVGSQAGCTTSEPATAVEAPPMRGARTEEGVPLLAGEGSGPGVAVERPEGDKEQGRDCPIWVTFEPCLGPWTRVEKGDQMMATHAFRRWGIERFEIGAVTDVEKEQIGDGVAIVSKLTIGFPATSTILKKEWLKSLPAAEEQDPESFLSVPFVLLDRSLKRKIGRLDPRCRLPQREKTLIRERGWPLSDSLNTPPEEP